MVIRLPALVLGATLIAAPLWAAPQEEINATLGADTEIWNGLFAIALADQIRENCDSISARNFRAMRFIYGLYGRAREYGYSRQDIQAFQRDDAVGDRMRAEVMAYFAENGVREGASETYCALGLAEISADTPAGNLLRAR
tara:strand:- start:3353 stop:3775 length:423 start_codon:yes stop_codon:yes gene_type:complete